MNVHCTIRKLFQDTSLDELCSQQNLVILKDTATVEQALRVRKAWECVHAIIELLFAVVCGSPELPHRPPLRHEPGWQFSRFDAVLLKGQ